MTSSPDARPIRIGDREYRDPVAMTRAPRGRFLHLAVLAVAAVADVGAFFQVVELVMPQQGRLLVLGMVLGFTGVVLYLAHVVGATFRDRVARLGSAHSAVALGCLLIWLALGAVAFWVRIAVPLDADGDGPSFSAAAPTAAAATGPDPTHAQAALFAGLYAATGAAAAAGAFLLRNPVRDAYATGARERRRATEWAAASAAASAGFDSYRECQVSVLTDAKTIRDSEYAARLALADRLKQHARVRMAQRAQDPAVTDAFFRAPGHQFDDGPSTNGHHAPDPAS
jgi:hypothetical protein